MQNYLTHHKKPWERLLIEVMLRAPFNEASRADHALNLRTCNRPTVDDKNQFCRLQRYIFFYKPQNKLVEFCSLNIIFLASTISHPSC